MRQIRLAFHPQVTQPLLDALDSEYATGAKATAFLALQVWSRSAASLQRGCGVCRTGRAGLRHRPALQESRQRLPRAARLQSCMNHSCDPNCSAAAEDGCARVSLVATRAVASGEELTISYIDVSLPYKERRCRGCSSAWMPKYLYSYLYVVGPALQPCRNHDPPP